MHSQETITEAIERQVEESSLGVVIEKIFQFFHETGKPTSLAHEGESQSKRDERAHFLCCCFVDVYVCVT